MKKSVFLIVLITFVVSVLYVGIFGMQIISWDTRVYVEALSPVSITASTGEEVTLYPTKGEENSYSFRLTYVEGLEVLINYELNPANATDKKVEITVLNQNEERPIVEIGSMNTIKFLRKAAARLQFRCLDGSDVKMTIAIYLK